MALFNHQLAEQITALVLQRYRSLGQALGATTLAEEAAAETAFQHNLNLLIEVANGRHMRSEIMLRRIELALEQLLDLLLGNALQSKAVFPEDFWQSEIGILVSRTRWWISAEDLITISNAAALAFGQNNQANRMRISRAIDNGLLDWVPDPSVANPQQNRRVLRSQVERLRDLSRLPELGD
ncbi:MAG TPA: hypothetical protein DEF47_14855 [Herpetosiphon sp.]|uniref:Uncharacterized protein n=1 Tax=Herpetosiphon aurantiacus (strain ATCC 23779 / DSM 785 / 114-95) TaxID=316274 RepID=A9B2R2_HERA2|nr:hypothetical protein [Herpetosiphon sp.]ABX05513.1 hypothetical protein Haur_2875 [Herpetosiphon aurantiacus DSM 785]HBW51172.1 hypothetical protein [Herpetosiphon sp.]